MASVGLDELPDCIQSHDPWPVMTPLSMEPRLIGISITNCQSYAHKSYYGVVIHFILHVLVILVYVAGFSSLFLH